MSYSMLVLAKKIVSEMKDFYQVNEPIKVEKSDIETIEFLIEQAEKYRESRKQLMEQVERVEELELEINDWRDEVKKWQQFYEESEESHLETKELLKSIVNQNKRYREALNSIITLWIASTDATDDTWLAHEMSETARKALGM